MVAHELAFKTPSSATAPGRAELVERKTSNSEVDGSRRMEIDADRIDETVLALLYLTLHEGRRAWKTFDWDSMNRLYAKGFISNPVGKAKSVAFTDKGLE